MTDRANYVQKEKVFRSPLKILLKKLGVDPFFTLEYYTEFFL
jgi:hypothetical protein